MKQKKSTRTNPSAGLIAFRRDVWRYYRKNGRYDLLWRHTKDPYRILVSEIMLQQTQVSRVKAKYKEFLKAFPNVRILSEASLGDVLKVWSGLGYNRRAKFLHDAAEVIMSTHKGRFPKDYALLRALPGIGDYTAKAVRVFAFNEPEVLIETNVRTVYLSQFHIWNSSEVSDEEILKVAERAAMGQDPLEWHWALMDYGAHLKASGVRVNTRSKHYIKQSKFEGSLRQVRGAILKAVAQNSSLETVQNLYKNQYQKAFVSLAREGLITT